MISLLLNTAIKFYQASTYLASCSHCLLRKFSFLGFHGTGLTGIWRKYMKWKWAPILCLVPTLQSNANIRLMCFSFTGVILGDLFNLVDDHLI